MKIIKTQQAKFITTSKISKWSNSKPMRPSDSTGYANQTTKTKINNSA